MRNLTLAVFPIIFVLFIAFPAAGNDLAATVYNGHAVVAGRVMVVFESNYQPAHLRANLAAAGFVVSRVSNIYGQRITATQWLAQPERRPGEERYALVEFDPARSVQTALAEIESLPGVAEAWPDHLVFLNWTPNDPYYPNDQKNLQQIGLEKAWNRTRGGNVMVAVLDTGYKLSGLSDPAETILDGYDFGENDDDPTDTEGHGTHVANIIAEGTNNNIGCAGAAPSVRLLPVKVFPDYSGGASESDIIDGIDWAVDQGARVINMSLGGSGYNSVCARAISDAVDQGVVVVVASGNDGDMVDYPAAYEDSIAVGSCNKHDLGDYPIRSDFSNFGDDLDLVAPGEAIVGETFGPQGVGYYLAWGTSVASPHVAAAAALLIASRDGNNHNVAEIRDSLESMANRRPGTDWDMEVGWGEVDVDAAMVDYAGEIPNEPPSAAIIASPRKGKAPLEVKFTAGATDPDGNIERYLWSFSSGETYNNIFFTHTFEQAGEYTVLLSVTDTEGASASDEVVITVSAPDEQSEEKDDGGCSVSTTGQSGSWSLLLVAMSIWLVRRRRFWRE